MAVVAASGEQCCLVVIDISDRKQVEQALLERTQHFSTIFYASPIAIAISRWDTGVFFDVNDAFIELFGYVRDEIIGHTAAEQIYLAGLRCKIDGG